MLKIHWHHKRLSPLIVGLVMACAWTAKAETLPPIHAVEIHPARDYAIVIGETIAAEILIRAESGVELETNSLPMPDSAASEYLELREVKWTRQAEDQETQYRINLVYQVFKGVRDAETVSVPALPLRFRLAGETLETQAPAWNFTLLPIIPAKIPDEAVILRGDLPAPVYSNAEHKRWLWACLAGLFGLIIHACGLLGLFSRRAPPFVHAARKLKKLGKQRPSLETWQVGARLVHGALNETAGHSLFRNQLPHFLAEYSCYSDLQAELEQFFDLSDRLFFANSMDYPSEYPFTRLETLCRKLAATAKIKR